MLQLYGLGKQSPQWGVCEKSSPGYSRVYYIYGGTVDYITEGMRQRLPPGKLYIFPSACPYSIVHDPEDTLCCLWMHIDFFPALTRELVTLSVSENTPLWHHLQLLWDTFQGEPEEGAYFYHLVEAFTIFLVHYLSLPRYSDTLKNILFRLREAASDQNLSIQGVANEFGYSTEHFIRLFQKELKLTPYQYLLNLRLTQATALLLEGTPVHQVAPLVGYHDPKTFGNAFKHKFSVSPSQYQRYYQPIP